MGCSQSYNRQAQMTRGNSLVPLFKVTLPVWNAENHHGEAIRSILNKTETSFELLIMDDGDTNDSQSFSPGSPTATRGTG